MVHADLLSALRVACLLAAAGAAACGARALSPELPPAPPASAPAVPVEVERTGAQRPRIDTPRDDVVEVLHGRAVSDPYRWLENDGSPRVKRWVDEENRLTERLLGRVPARAAIRAELEELIGLGQVTVPTVRRTADGRLRYFFRRRVGSENQPILYVRDGLDGPDQPLVDPNTMSASGAVALDWYFPSKDGALLAYGTSGTGSENSMLRVRNVSTGRDLPDTIERTRYASLCWKRDGRSFYYSRYPAPGTVPTGDETLHRRIYEHVLGHPPERDRLIYGTGRAPNSFPSCSLSPNGRWLVIRESIGWNKSELFLADTTAPRLVFTELTSRQEQLYDAFPTDETLYLRTNEGAPRYALYAVNPTNPSRDQWRPVLAEHPTDVLETVEVVGGQLLVGYAHAGVSRLERFDASGKTLGPIELPGPGASGGFSGLPDGDEAFFDFESFLSPSSVFRLDVGSGTTSLWQRTPSSVDPDDYVVTQGAARSKDGAQIPYLMVSRKDVSLTARDNPTLLYGYGGFNVTLRPRFTRTAFVLLERGGVYVQANLRGGGEFGEDWHRSGTRENKQRTFDDFIAVARSLITRGVTNPARLAIHGQSNGGLLVAASVVQAPHLFRAAVSSVPLTDMLRFDRFLLGKLWIPEFGSPSEPRDFEWLSAYSPYHRVQKGVAYPAVLFTTASGDTRVAPLHARKMAAALAWATSSERPILLRTELNAGHGAGKPTSLLLDEYTDFYSFVLWQLGVIDGPEASL
ncbi:MAG: prolyl oligopeptidase family serine peptidase [Sorangiineae bacterium]|nr:prolyl oligopeptidase family serine peptidase [Polyangiaceae bacterium]MEB2321982.1 prolyl oligopeptidase family serine peptidase [Sorangiineae bacterium]